METPTEFTHAEEIQQNQEIAIVSEKNFELIFNGKVDEKIALVEKELKSILRKDVSDEKAYKDMKDLKNKVIVKMRTATIAKSKEMTEGYKENIKTIKEVENSIIEKVTTKLESKADTFIEKHEALKIEAEEKAKREAKEKLDNRVKTLIESGILFTGSWYSINEIQVGIQMIQEMSDDDYNNLLSKVKAQNELNIAEMKRKDEEAKEFQRIQDQLRIENEKNKSELEAGRLELRSGQLELLGIAVTKEYELLMKESNNDEWKEWYANMKSKKITEKRNQELRPYIIYIRDYNAMIALDEEKYQNELYSVKQAKIDQEEYDRKEALKESERQEREQKEKEVKIKQDALIIADRAKKYENLGFRFSYATNEWSLTIGTDYSPTFTKEDMLNEPEGQYEAVKSAVERETQKENDHIAKVEADRQAKAKADAEEAELKRKSLLDDTQKYNEYINALSKIEIPHINDIQLSEILQKIKNLLVVK